MAIGGGHRAPSRVTNVKNSVQPVTVIGSRGQPPRGDFSFSFFNHVSERSYRIRSSYTSKCPVRPVFPCPNLSLRSRCASSREQFRTVSPLSRFLPSIVLNRDREFPRSGFRSHRMAKNQRRKRRKKKKKIKVAQPLCYRWSSPKRTTLDRGVVTVSLLVSPSLTPLRQVGSSASFTEGTG